MKKIHQLLLFASLINGVGCAVPQYQDSDVIFNDGLIQLKGTYQNPLAHGRVVSRYPDGKIATEVEVLKGRILHARSFTPTGKLAATVERGDGQLVRHYPDGSVYVRQHVKYTVLKEIVYYDRNGDVAHRNILEKGSRPPDDWDKPERTMWDDFISLDRQAFDLPKDDEKPENVGEAVIDLGEMGLSLIEVGVKLPFRIIYGGENDAEDRGDWRD